MSGIANERGVVVGQSVSTREELLRLIAERV